MARHLVGPYLNDIRVAFEDIFSRCNGCTRTATYEAWLLDSFEDSASGFNSPVTSDDALLLFFLPFFKTMTFAAGASSATAPGIEIPVDWNKGLDT
jgi:hypothetical protein